MDPSAWIGPVGDVWAAEWRRTDRSFAGLAPHLDAAILARAPDTGVAVDIGSGAGSTAIALAGARPGLAVTGIDLSPALVAVARERGAWERGAPLANLTFRSGAVEDAVGQSAPVDLFVSRHGVMFFGDPVAAMTSLRQAAAPGAWLVFSCFGDVARNGWAGEMAAAVAGTAAVGACVHPACYAPGPFGFADPDVVATVLDRAGWMAEPPVAIDFAYRAGARDVGADAGDARHADGRNDPVADALGFLTRIGPAAAALRALPPGEVNVALGRMRTAIARRAGPDAVDFPAMAWLWSARAV